MERKILPPKDRAIAVAAYYGSGREAEYRLAGNPGLILVVAKPNRRGETGRVWRCYYSASAGGKRQRRKMRLGRYPVVELAEARARAAEIMSAVERGEDPMGERRPISVMVDSTRLTLADLIESYFSDRANLASIQELRRELQKDLLPHLGGKRPSDITPGDIDMVASNILERGAPAMARRVIMHVKAIYNYCLLDAPRLAEKFEIRTNPAQHLGRHRRGATSRYGVARPRVRVLDDEEIRSWTQALVCSGMSREIKLMLLLIITTAQRPGEIRRLTRDQIKTSQATPLWIIPEHVSKNGRRHIVPLSPLALHLLASPLSAGSTNCPYLFVGSGGDAPKRKGALPMAMATLFRKHLPHLSPATAHGLRRTAATGMRRIGVPPEIVSMILNHSRLDVTGRHYDHYEALPERADALRQWEQHLCQQCGDTLKMGIGW